MVGNSSVEPESLADCTLHGLALGLSPLIDEGNPR